jgi:hypothetical protein
VGKIACGGLSIGTSLPAILPTRAGGRQRGQNRQAKPSPVHAPCQAILPTYESAHAPAFPHINHVGRLRFTAT